MSTKTWSHVSPTTGIGLCSAQSPASCRYQDSKHFSASAAERIKIGRPANFDEHEAMVQHQEITAKHNFESGTNQSVLQKPKPQPKPQARPAPTPAPARPAAPFPTQHRTSQPAETLYHMDLGFPPNFTKPTGRKELEYSRHALSATLDDRYGKIPIINATHIEKLQLVELGVANGKVSKMVYRGHLDKERDMCIVVIPKPANEKWFVKTVWINLRSDQHKTLDESKYTKP